MLAHLKTLGVMALVGLVIYASITYPLIFALCIGIGAIICIYMSMYYLINGGP